MSFGGKCGKGKEKKGGNVKERTHKIKKTWKLNVDA
jgi:hypothetical protein